MPKTELFVGTSGYSYKEWKGPFYPEDLPNSKMLEYYSRQLTSVEINNTFYRLPRSSVLEAWSEQAPAAFRFVLKASRRITHFKRLKPPYDETDYLLETAGVLGEKLGAILFQLPPNMKKDSDRLAAFLDHLPRESKAAFEFRHDSWFDEDVYNLLRKHACPLVLADTDEKPVLDLVKTSEWIYCRLRRPGYTREDLARWAGDIISRKWTSAFVFFKHEDEGAGPRMARDFRELFESL